MPIAPPGVSVAFSGWVVPMQARLTERVWSSLIAMPFKELRAMGVILGSLNCANATPCLSAPKQNKGNKGPESVGGGEAGLEGYL